jgi:hypothetical protein
LADLLAGVVAIAFSISNRRKHMAVTKSIAIKADICDTDRVIHYDTRSAGNAMLLVTS